MSATPKPNAFTGAFKPVQIKPTPISKKLATRVNREICIAKGKTNSEVAPR